MLAPPVVSRLARDAPLAELAIVAQTPDVLERLDARRVDFLVGAVIAAPERFGRDVVMTETLSWVVRAGHPLGQAQHVDLEMLVSVPHVVIAKSPPGLSDETVNPLSLVSQASWEDAGAFDAALAAQRLTRRIGVRVPDTYSALAIASRSDMAALIPRRLALLSAQSGRVELIEPPYPSPSVEMSLVYLKERLNEPAIAWMRDVIRSVAAGL